MIHAILIPSDTTSKGITDTVEIIVKPVLASNIELTSAKKAIKLGESINLNYKVLPNNTTNKDIVWKSSDENIATVKDGKVTGISNGTVTITATTSNDITNSITLDVYKAYTISNILQNSGFEQTNDLETGNWISSIYGQSSINTQNKYQGNYSFSYTAQSSCNYCSSAIQKVTINKNHVYYAMEYVYVDKTPVSG